MYEQSISQRKFFWHVALEAACIYIKIFNLIYEREKYKYVKITSEAASAAPWMLHWHFAACNAPWMMLIMTIRMWEKGINSHEAIFPIS